MADPGVSWRVLERVVVLVDGVPVELTGRRQLEVAAYLALHPRTTVTSDALQHVLWGETPPRTARNSVQRFISDLRRALGPAADRIRTTDDGYQLLLQPADRIDWLDLRDDVKSARMHLAAGDPQSALAAVGAQAHRRGEPLAGLTPEVLTEDRRRMVDLLDEAAELAVTCRVETGELEDAITDAERLLERRPFREPVWAVLITALHRLGRTGEALDAYGRLASLLREELGQDPSRALQDLHVQVLRDDPALREGRVVGTVAKPGSTVPAERSSLHGRHDELAAIESRLGEHRLVSIVGVAGVGKTRMAGVVARRAEARGEQVRFVELAGVGSVADVRRAVTEGRGGRFRLLVLDNCEHVIDVVVALVEELLAADPTLRVLTTSREALRIEGEQVIQLSPLDPATDGAAMFRARALAAGADLRDTDADDVAVLCRAVDGLPLAIEIAASRAAALGMATLRRNLGPRLSVLDGEGQRTIERHRTLHAAIRWSYGLLLPREQEAFRVLGVFPAGFELDAATQVLRTLGFDEAEVPRLLTALVQRSMVTVDTDHGLDRYRLLEVIRSFALRLLAEADDDAAEAVHRSHAQWVGTLTSPADPDLLSRDCTLAEVRLQREAASLREALRWAAQGGQVDLFPVLCGSGTSLLLMGRPELGDAVLAMTETLPDEHPARLARGVALWGRAFSEVDHELMATALSTAHAAAPGDPLGFVRMLESGYLITLTGAVEQATAIRRDIITDQSVPQGMRDHVLANALYGAHVAGRPDLADPDWAARCATLATTSSVPITRLLARIALARAHLVTEPSRALQWIGMALTEDGPMPLSLRRIWTASIGRMLTQLAPGDAATHLLGLLAEEVREGYQADQTTLVSSAVLLGSVDHPFADDAAATVGLTMYENLARSLDDIDDRIARGAIVPPAAFIERLAAALRDVADEHSLTAATA